MKLFRNALSTLAVLSALVAGSFAQSIGNSSPAGTLSFTAGRFVANNYNYGNPTAGGQSSAGGQVVTGNSVTGSASITVRQGYIVLPDGRSFLPYAVGVPIIIVDAAPELVTPTAVSGCSKTAQGVAGGSDAPFVTCTITASFAAVHGTYALIASATGGAAEAAYDAQNWGGGLVVLSPGWKLGLNTSCTACFANQAAAMAGILPYNNVSFEDIQGGGPPQYWSLTQGASTLLAVPTTLTAVTALPSATPVGAYGTGTYHLCVAYVDIGGQEGACSADFSEAGLATGSFIFTPPAASAGAVGYTIYISLTSGTYSLAYQVPLTSTVCRLTTLETLTPACAVTNATYGQIGATATVTAITVNTSPVGMQLGGVSGTLLTGNPNGRTTYIYTPASHDANAGIPSVSFAFTAGGIGSATPIAIGTVNLPAAFMNQAGKTIRVCGKFLNTDVNSSIQNIDFYWDAAGSDVAGSGVKIGGLAATGTGTAAAYEGSFCDTFVTTVSGAGVTAGSIIPSFGNLQYALVSSGNIVGNGADTKAAATGSLNLAGGAGFGTRLSIVHNNTTGNATPQLQTLTIEVI